MKRRHRITQQAATEDFASRSSEDDFPSVEKFWINGETNMLEVLNERGEKLQKP